jgi:hypothetical protein
VGVVARAVVVAGDGAASEAEGAEKEEETEEAVNSQVL